ncbi:unnamed protein product, partial [Ectocarpus fasciculatus]
LGTSTTIDYCDNPFLSVPFCPLSSLSPVPLSLSSRFRFRPRSTTAVRTAGAAACSFVIRVDITATAAPPSGKHKKHHNISHISLRSLSRRLRCVRRLPCLIKNAHRGGMEQC